MNWIEQLFNKARYNSSQRKIQIQFLIILMIVAYSIIGFQLYLNNWSVFSASSYAFVVLIISGFVYFKPVILRPLLFVWLFTGLVLGEITSTIILALIFYFMFVPITICLRVMNRKKNMTKPKWIYRDNHRIDYNKLY